MIPPWQRTPPLGFTGEEVVISAIAVAETPEGAIRRASTVVRNVGDRVDRYDRVNWAGFVATATFLSVRPFSDDLCVCLPTVDRCLRMQPRHLPIIAVRARSVESRYQGTIPTCTSRSWPVRPQPDGL